MSQIVLRHSARSRRQRGMTLVEVLLAAAVLAFGLAGLAVLFTTAIASARGTRLDTNATLVAKLVLEQIAAQDPQSSTNPIPIKDCTGAGKSINVTAAASPGAGAQLNTTPGTIGYGGIDFVNQTLSAVPAGYKMQYVDCGSNNTNPASPVNAVTYEVRWNVMTFGTDSSGNPTAKMITVAARQYHSGSGPMGRAYYMIPVSLRAVEGRTQ